MSILSKTALFGSALAAALTMSATAISAAPYEAGDKITVIIGYKPGGGSDRMAQLIQPYLSKAMNLKFVNQYLPGASGAIAWTKVANMTRVDGYTICITNTPSIQTAYLLNKEITYNIRDFVPIANVVTDPGILVVGKDSPYKTFEDFLEAAKATPGKITVGNSGVGGDDHLSVLYLSSVTGANFRNIPFAGDGPSWTAAMGGKIDASSNNLGITYPQIKAGNLRALAIYAAERSSKLPDVPTLKELGFDLENGSSRGFSAPKGFPEDKLEFLIEGFRKVLNDPEFLAEAERQAQTIDPKLGNDYGKMLLDIEKLVLPLVDKMAK